MCDDTGSISGTIKVQDNRTKRTELDSADNIWNV